MGTPGQVVRVDGRVRKINGRVVRYDSEGNCPECCGVEGCCYKDCAIVPCDTPGAIEVPNCEPCDLDFCAVWDPADVDDSVEVLTDSYNLSPQPVSQTENRSFSTLQQVPIHYWDGASLSVTNTFTGSINQTVWQNPIVYNEAHSGGGTIVNPFVSIVYQFAVGNRELNTSGVGVPPNTGHTVGQVYYARVAVGASVLQCELIAGFGESGLVSYNTQTENCFDGNLTSMASGNFSVNVAFSNLQRLTGCRWGTDINISLAYNLNDGPRRTIAQQGACTTIDDTDPIPNGGNCNANDNVYNHITPCGMTTGGITLSTQLEAVRQSATDSITNFESDFTTSASYGTGNPGVPVCQSAQPVGMSQILRAGNPGSSLRRFTKLFGLE